MKTFVEHVALPAVALLLALLPAACATTRGQFTRPNYETLYQDEPADEVRAKLGPPMQAGPQPPTPAGAEPMPAGEIFRERVGREPKESAAIDFWTYQHSAPFYKAQLVFENGHLVGGAGGTRTPPSHHPRRPLTSSACRARTHTSITTSRRLRHRRMTRSRR